MRTSMTLRSLLLIIVCSFCLCLEAKPPELSAKDTRIKVEEILKAHVSHQKLTEEIVSRAIQNYLEELDPSKTYFLDSDIKNWIKPSSTLLQQTLDGYKREDFSLFEEIHKAMLSAILR